MDVSGLVVIPNNSLDHSSVDTTYLQILDICSNHLHVKNNTINTRISVGIENDIGQIPISRFIELVNNQSTIQDLSRASIEVRKVGLKYPDFKGVFVWEHDLTKPAPVYWASVMKAALDNCPTPERVKNAILNRPKKKLKTKKDTDKTETKVGSTKFCAVL